MKKFVYGVLCFSIIGAVLSGFLIIQHNNPENAISRMLCGGGLLNPCIELSQSKFADLFGVPIAAYGLLFYLLVLFIILIADYADNRYLAYSMAILLPLSFLSIIADIALGIILIIERLPCLLCIATYGINICILVLLFGWYRTSGDPGRGTLKILYKEIFFTKDASSDRKAFYASFMLFLFLLPFAIFSTSNILKLKSDATRPSTEQIQSEIRGFYQQRIENIEFPDNGIVIGNPEAEISIVVFTDFLCSYCYKFYLVEEFLLSRYKDRIKIIYYNYPLDKSCNPHVARTVYKNSCIASRALLAASEAGIAESYIVKHFSEYKNFDNNYDQNRPLSVLSALDPKEVKDVTGPIFQALMDSAKTMRTLEEHIALAKKLGIEGTPALFVNNRRIDGYRPVQVMDAIIKNELSRKKLL